MPLPCTRCESSGFLNAEQLPDHLCPFEVGHSAVLYWVAANKDHDAQVCDCCGNGEEWYGTPGEHYGQDDPAGPNGPYAYNSGLCECH